MTVQDSSRLGLRRDVNRRSSAILDIGHGQRISPSTVIYNQLQNYQALGPGCCCDFLWEEMGDRRYTRSHPPILATKKLSLKELTNLLPRTIYQFYPAHNEGSRLRPPRERTFATTFSSRLRKRLSKMPTRRRCLVANKW